MYRKQKRNTAVVWELRRWKAKQDLLAGEAARAADEEDRLASAQDEELQHEIEADIRADLEDKRKKKN